MIDWPASLVEEIVGQRCVFFLGAGASAGSLDSAGRSPPGWLEFLEQAKSLVGDQGKRAAIEMLISERRLLVALQAIKENSNQSQYQALLNDTFNRNYRANRVHEIIYSLDAKVVVTTNFDKIYETYCNSFAGGEYAYKTISYRQDDLADELRSDTRIIIKAHGTIDAISEMIFTRAEYYGARRTHGYFYSMLKAIFLTNTIVFIGCGLDDPDLALLLEDVHIAGRYRKPHYALALKGDRNPLVIDDWRKTYNIEVLEYSPSHTQLAVELTQLLEYVESHRAARSGALV